MVTHGLLATPPTAECILIDDESIVYCGDYVFFWTRSLVGPI